MKALVSWTVTATVEIDDEVIDGALTDEWRKDFYPFHTREDVIELIAYNMLRGTRLEMIDGFADRSDDEAAVNSEDWDLNDCEVVK